MSEFFNNNYLWAYPLLGVFIGVFAGLTGLGGGAVLVPLLVLVFAKSQKLAQGTSLAMIFSPGALPAIWRYHRDQNVDWGMVLGVAPFMLVGSYFGAMFAAKLPQGVLKIIIALILTYVAAYMIFGKGTNASQSRAVLLSFIPVVALFVVAMFNGNFARAAAEATVPETTPETTPQAASDAAEQGTAPAPDAGPDDKSAPSR